MRTFVSFLEMSLFIPSCWRRRAQQSTPAFRAQHPPPLTHHPGFPLKFLKAQGESQIRRIPYCSIKPYMMFPEKKKKKSWEKDGVDGLLTTCSRTRSSHAMALTLWLFCAESDGGGECLVTRISWQHWRNPTIHPFNIQSSNGKTGAGAQASSWRPRGIFLRCWYICFSLN